MSVFEEFVKVNRLKKKDVAEYLNVSAAFITQLVQGVRSVPEDSVALIKANSKWNTSMFGDKYILSNKSDMLEDEKPNTLSISLNSNRQPIFDIRVSAGHGVGLEGNENDAVEWVSIPKFDGCYGIMVYGDSMYDRFKSGDVVFVRPIKGRNDFDFGQCYVVITNEDRYIKNIYESPKGDGYITMTSYNIELNPDGRRKYPDKDIYVNDIKHLYKVAGKLRRDQL